MKSTMEAWLANRAKFLNEIELPMWAILITLSFCTLPSMATPWTLNADPILV
jgi:hypothetical protein